MNSITVKLCVSEVKHITFLIDVQLKGINFQHTFFTEPLQEHKNDTRTQKKDSWHLFL